MLRDHDFEQLPVEPLRARLDLAEIEARLDVEIIGAGAVLKVEIDQARRGLALGAGIEQQHRGLHRQRGDAGAAHGRQEGEDLRFRGLGRGRLLGDAGASLRQFDRRHRLDQKVRHAQLHQPAHGGAVESRHHRDDGRPGADARHQPLERQHFGFIGGIEIGDHNGGAVNVDLLAIRQPAADDIEADLRAGAERGARRRLEAIVGGQEDHSGLKSGGDGAADTHGSNLARGHGDHCDACCGGAETTVVVVVLEPDPIVGVGAGGGTVTCSVGGDWLEDSICIGSTGWVTLLVR